VSDQPSPSAPGAPGVSPTWSSSNKDAVGTSLRSSRVWFTVGHGILNEVYWPRPDRPQIRDLGFIVADDAGFWSEVKRDAEHVVRDAAGGVPAITSVHNHERYRLTLRICTDDHADVVRIEAHLEDRRDPSDPGRAGHPLRLYPLLAPHLGFGGRRGTAWTGDYKGQPMVFAEAEPWALALAASPAPLRQSVGYVGQSDGWQDFAANASMVWAYTNAGPGNVAAMIELAPNDEGRAEIVLAFGERAEDAGLAARSALVSRFEIAWRHYCDNWQSFLADAVDPPAALAGPERDLYLTSASVLRCLQDRAQPGATVASLSIPWGNSRNDLGGYHLVWARDLVETAGAFVALGLEQAARGTLAYLVASQEAEGNWPQNQWIDGAPYWTGMQLDEAAYPVLLVDALRSGAVGMHGPSGTGAAAVQDVVSLGALDAMIVRAAGYIARHGPATGEDRWEESAGLAPSTLAPVVAALVAAADYLPGRAAAYCRELADDWNASIEDWTYARGTDLAREHGVDGYYVRIASPQVLSGAPLSTPVELLNQPGGTVMVPADQLVGTDFLALVRFGLRLPDDPAILSTLKIADALLRTDTPSGPVWHRYTGDGYGEHADGGPYDGAGIGRGWPLLVGERGHYELAAGRDALPYLETMRHMGSGAGMLPEQVWDAEPIAALELHPGRPSGSAMPLAWAHAEFVKLARSIAVGQPVDRPAAAWQRYRGKRPLLVRATWRLDARRTSMAAGRTLRVELPAPARVHFSLDGGGRWADVESADTGLGIWIADVPGSRDVVAGGAVDFTVYWTATGDWQDGEMHVAVVDPPQSTPAAAPSSRASPDAGGASLLDNSPREVRPQRRL
jgi:glucoamylase